MTEPVAISESLLSPQNASSASTILEALAGNTSNFASANLTELLLSLQTNLAVSLAVLLSYGQFTESMMGSTEIFPGSSDLGLPVPSSQLDMSAVVGPDFREAFLYPEVFSGIQKTEQCVRQCDCVQETTSELLSGVYFANASVVENSRRVLESIESRQSWGFIGREFLTRMVCMPSSPFFPHSPTPSCSTY